MKTEIIWSALAVKKFEEFADYIALDKPQAALKWAVKIQDVINNLINSPQLGREVPELRRADIREIIKGNYRIVKIDIRSVSIL